MIKDHRPPPVVFYDLRAARPVFDIEWQKGAGKMEREELEEQLSTVDEVLFFLLFIVAGVFLSFRATVVQREGICAALRGETPALGAVYPLRHGANSMVVGALGFFLCLAMRAWRERDTEDEAACRSAHLNLLAAGLVLAAAMVRYEDVETLRRKDRI